MKRFVKRLERFSHQATHLFTRRGSRGRGRLQRRRHRLEQLEARALLSIGGLDTGQLEYPAYATRSALAVPPITTTASTAPLYLANAVVTDQTGVSGGIVPATDVSGPLIRIDQFRADPRFAGIDGTGFSTVILDTGIDVNHPFFGPDANGDGVADRIAYQFDYANNDTDATDGHGHGSNVSSIVASQDGVYTGMAPGANIIALKVLSDTGGGSFAWLESALQWVVANAATYNIASINMSLGDSGNYGSPQTLYGIDDELAAIAAMDVMVVSASGNDFFTFGSGQGVSYPSADPNSLSIGAVYDENIGSVAYGGAIAFTTGPDRITPFSQRHQTMTTVMAPGAAITGADQNGGTVVMHGTSQASPHVAGIAALAQQLAVQTLGRRLTQVEFRNLLQQSGIVVNDGDDEDDNVANTNLDFRRVDVVNLGQAILDMGPTPNPTLTLDILADSVSEGAGPAATTGVVTRTNGDMTVPLTITLTSSDTTEIAVPTTVTIPANQASSLPFNVSAVDDLAVDGTQTVTVTTSATGYPAASDTIQVTDNDSGGTGEIRGSKWNDLDGDGIRDTSEPALPGWTIFLDENQNGRMDQSAETVPSADVPKAIPDQSSITSTILVDSIQGPLADVDVTLDITHTWDSDLTAVVISPAGTRVKLFGRVGGSGQNFTNTILDDEGSTSIKVGTAPFAGVFRPDDLLSLLDGQNGNGVWTLEVTDGALGDEGSLNNWSVTLTSSERNTRTDANGNYVFSGLSDGVYTVTEELQAGWEQTSPGGVADLYYVYDPADDHLYTVDPAGTVTVLGPAGGDLPVSGLAFDPGWQILYGSSNTGQLWTFDLTTGAARVLGTLPMAIEFGLAYSPLSGKLYSVNGEGDLVEIDPATLSATVKNSNGPGYGGGGLAYNPRDARMYVYSNGSPNVYSYSAIDFSGPALHPAPTSSPHYGMADNGSTLVLGPGTYGGILSAQATSYPAGLTVPGFTTTASTAVGYTTGTRVAGLTGGEGTVGPATGQSGPLIRIDEFRADPRFAGIDGSGYSTVIIDTGIDVNHPFFGPDANGDGVADRIVYQWDFANNDADASDFDGHGSNVTSIVASQDATYPGMAPAANIIHLKVFPDAAGAGFLFSDLERALQWVVANAVTFNIASVNMSLVDWVGGTPGNYNSPQSLYGIGDELANLVAMNVVVVSCSGNSFFTHGSVQGVSYPAADPNSLSVGAVYDADIGPANFDDGTGLIAIANTTGPDRITAFSKRHQTMTTVMAPGSAITGAGYNGGTSTYNGTSQASPHIAGIAVLAQELAVQTLGRRLTQDEFRTLLQQTGVVINDGDDEDDNVTNTDLDFRRVDVVRLGEAILDMAPPGPGESVGTLFSYDPATGSSVPLFRPGILGGHGFGALEFVQGGSAGSRTVTITGGSIAANANFGNRLVTTGEIRGYKWNDVDGDGVRDAGEEGLEGWTIFADQNHNGVFDLGLVSAASADPARPVPDLGAMTSTIQISGTSGPIADVNVTLDISHTWDADLNVFLIGPSGTRVELFRSVGGSGDNFSRTTLDDQAAVSITEGAAPFTGSFRPTGRLAAFLGQSAEGIWTLQVADGTSGETGTLNGWSISIAYSSEPFTSTNFDGSYAFRQMPSGSYTLAEVLRPDWEQTTPRGGKYWGYDSAADRLFFVDAAGTVTTLGMAGGDLPISGLAYDAARGVMYGTSNMGRLWTFDLATGAATSIAFLGMPLESGLTYNPLDRRLYSVTRTGALVQIDPIAITATVMSAPGPGVGASGISFDPRDGRIYVYSPGLPPGSPPGTPESPQVFSYDAWTFADRRVHAVPVIVPQGGMAFNGTSLVLGAGPTGTQQNLFTYDPATGSMTPVFPTGALNGLILDGLEYVAGGSQTATVTPGVVVSDVSFGNRSTLGAIRGATWNDEDGDRSRGVTEPGLAGWTVYVDADRDGQLDQTTVSVPSTDVPFQVPDLGTIRSVLVANGLDGVLADVNVTLDITHNRDGDLKAVLISPSGRRVVLLDGVGADGRNFTGTILDDQVPTPIAAGTAPFTGSFRPQGQLSDFAGENPNGVWSLELSDKATGNIGMLNSWSLALTYAERSTQTGPAGDYLFGGLAAGAYTVAEVNQPGWEQTYPVAGSHSFVLGIGEVRQGVDFGNQRSSIDWGDAPDPTYPTLAASNGASHRIVAGFYLGASVDGDSNGQPSAGALGDDLTGIPDDEDGVAFLTPLVPGDKAKIRVTASAPGKLDAWLDFARDGRWAEAGDQIFTSVSLAAGAQGLEFDVPSTGSAVGRTFARFRFSSAGGLSYTGPANDGEVEDYEVVVQPRVFEGTPGADTFGFSTDGVRHIVTLNDVPQTFDASIISVIRFDGLGGSDVITVGGGSGTDTATVGHGYGDVVGPGGSYRVSFDGMEKIYVVAGGGSAQSATIKDSSRDGAYVGNDKFYAVANVAPQMGIVYMLYGDGSQSRVYGFGQVTGSATLGAGGQDAAYLYDTAAAENYTGGPTGGTMTLPGVYENIANGFDLIYAFSNTAGSAEDRAILADGPGNDNLYGTPTEAYFRYANGVLNYAQGFDKAEGQASASGDDAANLFDSAGNDEFTGSANNGRMAPRVGSAWEVKALGFERTYATARSGGSADRAVLSDSASVADDRLYSTPTESYIRYQNAALTWAKGFDQVELRASTGNDWAYFYDSAGNDVFTASATTASMAPESGAAYSNQASGFDRVYAYASAGSDKADLFDSIGNDRFTAWPDKSQMLYQNGQEFWAYAFDQVIGHATLATRGDDWATLNDSAGNDTYNGGMNSSSLAGPLGSGTYLNTALSFDRYYAYATKGGTNDVATLTDTPWDDSLYGHGQTNEAYIRYAAASGGTQNYTKGFDKVSVQANASATDVDRAFLYDTTGNDTFTGSVGKLGQMKNDLNNYWFDLLAFDQVTITSSRGGTDKATRPALVDYTLTRIGPWQDLP